MKENKVVILQLVILFVCIAFVTRLFYLQIIDSSYKEEAMSNAVRREIVYPYRGIIFDRNGKMLVSNTPVYDVMFTPKKLVIRDTAHFLKSFDITLDQFKAIWKNACDRTKGNTPNKPSVFLPRLTTHEYARVQEKLVNYPSMYINARSVRNYPSSCMANALGYIAEISEKQLEKYGKENYQPGDYIGFSGIEKEYEKELRGRRGVKYIMVNVHGVEKGSFLNGRYDTASVAGFDLTSTVDLDLQVYAEKLMQGKIGSVVAIEPSTGEILCFVSAPTYDPNLLTGKEYSKNFRTLNRDSLKPLYCRPLQGVYPPGSTFKPINYTVAQMMHVLDTNEVFPCARGLVNCHGRHSSANFHTGVQYSCNPYAYFIFRKILYRGLSHNKFIDTRLSFEQWRKNVLKFGLSQRLGIDLPFERPGNLPSVKYYNKYFGVNRWAFETIYSLGLGQGEVLVTPLQLANVAAIFANRGYYYSPHLIKKIGDKSTTRTQFLEKKQVYQDSIFFNSMISAMGDVVRAGTATMARSQVIEIAGKTGTAENPHGDDHSLFLGFAPKNNPKIAVGVVLENAGWGATAAAPLASLIIERYLRGEIKRTYLEEYVLKGQFIK
ncbi:MAG: penicillin-binding transpeptidase domain-containing protein [Cytophagales bacterium]